MTFDQNYPWWMQPQTNQQAPAPEYDVTVDPRFGQPRSQEPRGYRLAAMNPPQQAQGPMSGSIADLTRYFEQAGPADGNPGYWARVAAEKIGKGANLQDTLDHLTGRADFKTLGGSGGGYGGGMGGFTPMNSFQFGPASYSRFNAPQIDAPANFNYGGPQLEQPQNFGFPGVYAQPQAPRPQMAPQGQRQAPVDSRPALPPPPAEAGPDPTPGGDGVYAAELGGWLSKTHPLAQKYLAQYRPEGYQEPTPPAQQAPENAPPTGAVTNAMNPADFPGGGAAGQTVGWGEQGSGVPGPFSRGGGGDLTGQRASFDQSRNGSIGARQTAFQQGGQNSGRPSNIPAFEPAKPFEPSAPFQPTSTPKDPGAYQQAQTFGYGGVPQPERYNPNTFGYMQGVPKPERYNPNAFSFGQNVPTPENYTPGAFKAPTAEEAAQDPGYQFALNESLNQLKQDAARGGKLLTTGTESALMERAQKMAAQQYGDVYGRRFGEFGQQEAQKFGAAQYNTGAHLAAQGQGYGQAANTAGMNEANALNAAQFNTGAALQAQTTGYGQAANTAGMNEANQLNAAQFNTGAALQAQGQGYGQAANTAAQNEANRMNAYQASNEAQRAYQNDVFGQGANVYDRNYGNAFQASQAAQENARGNYGAMLAGQGQGFNQGLATRQQGQAEQNQAFGQSMSQAQFNAANQAAYQQQAWQQQYQPWAQNASNQLQAGSANLQAGVSTNALNANQEQSEWQNNYQNASNAYQSDVSQRQFGAGMGLNYAQFGLQQQGQNFNQGLQSYTTNRDTTRMGINDEWGRQMDLANFGYGAAGGLNQGSQQYGSNLGGYYGQVGNAQAGGLVGGANPWLNWAGQAANTGLDWYGQWQAGRQDPYGRLGF